MVRTTTRALLIAGASLFAPFALGSAFAQTPVTGTQDTQTQSDDNTAADTAVAGDVIVTARRREESLLDVPDSAKIVEQILADMCEALSKGENVKISGFGTFVLRDKGERVGRNPKTGVEVPIAPRRVLTFRASQMMRERIVAAG